MLHNKLSRVDDEWRSKTRHNGAIEGMDYRTTDERMLSYQRQCDERCEETIKREVQRIRCVEHGNPAVGCFYAMAGS